LLFYPLMPDTHLQKLDEYISLARQSLDALVRMRLALAANDIEEYAIQAARLERLSTPDNPVSTH
jgi:hypothetical protein